VRAAAKSYRRELRLHRLKTNGPSRYFSLKGVGFLVLLVFLLTFAKSNATGKTAKLSFLPNTPVKLKSEIQIKIDQSLAGLPFSLRGNQLLEALLTLHGGQSDSPDPKPPFDVSFNLQSLKIDLRVNGNEISFDSGVGDSSLYSRQMSQMINRPVNLHFGSGYKLETSVQELMEAMPDLPFLKDVEADALFMDLFVHLFSLGGIELKEGDVIKKQFPSANFSTLPNQVIYTITSIDDYSIQAELKGNIEKKTFSLSETLQIDDEMAKSANVTINGTMEGKVKWKKDNAMLYDLAMCYACKARVQIANWDWMINIRIDLHNQTKPQEAS